jgi:hypothetical protein
MKMSKATAIPPKVLVKTWLELTNSDELKPLQRALIEQNIEKIFGSIELADIYVYQSSYPN